MNFIKKQLKNKSISFPNSFIFEKCFFQPDFK